MSAAAPSGRPPPSPADYEAILRAETRRGRWLRWSLHGCRVGLVVVVLAGSLHGAKVSPRDFWRRLPQLG